MRNSLKHKAVLLIILIALVLSAVTVVVSVRAVSDIIRINYETEATSLSRTVAAVVDRDALARLQAATKEIYDSIPPEERVSSDDWGSDAFYAYLSNFEALSETDDYKLIHRQLRAIQDANDVDCVYTAFIDVDSEKFIYLVDAAEEDACPVGCLDPIYEENRQLLKDPSIGFPTYTTNTKEYGYLATSGTTVFNEAGDVIGYAMVDVSMEDIASWRNRVLGILLGLQAVVIVLVIMFSITIVNRALVKPINQLSQAAIDYRKDENVTNYSHFSKLNIRTNDEIEDLSESMKKMEQDLNEKIENLLHTTSELTASRQEASKMSEIAMKDALTGVHNKRAYDETMRMLEESARNGDAERFGLAVIDLNGLKIINDTYGHEKGDISIKELCRIVCSVFAHSPVYRIGGDEFAVILKGHDLDNIETLMTQFNSALLTLSESADLEEWEKVSASIGYAVYDSERDDTPDETFRRADRAMYMRKQEMKATRK